MRESVVTFCRQRERYVSVMFKDMRRMIGKCAKDVEYFFMME